MAEIEFSQQQIKEMQSKGLEMLLYFKEICENNNLLFYLCGGCCIGAVRNGGFVPWDDDVDVFMPRQHYNKLIEIWNKQADTSRFSLQLTTKELITKNQFATICDNDTTFIKSFQADLDINHGLVLDILPIDGCPSGALARKLQKFWALIYSLFIIGLPPENHGKLVKLIGKVFLGLVPKRCRYKTWRFAERQMTKHPISDCELVTELCSGPYYMQFEYPAEAFKEAVYVDFEGHMVPLPKGYDTYLKMAFGDYMQLPPVEKRVIHHEMEFVDMNNSYKKYKGIKYFKN